MSTKELLNSKTLSDDFFSLQINQGDQTYQKSYFDKINSRLVFEQLKEEDDAKDDLVLVTPEDPTALLTVTVESLLALLKYDVMNSSSEHLKNLQPGQSVGLIENRVMYPGIFEGIDVIDGRKFYKVKRSDSKGLTENIPVGKEWNREWRIQPYSAAETVKRKRKITVFGKALEEILGLPAGGLKAFQKSKMLVVAPDKSRLIDAIRDVKIGGDPLEAIFPIADYTSTTDWQYVGTRGLNALKQEPLIGLVANCDIAVDIALRDPSYKLLVIDGASKLRAHYGSIERLNADMHPRKVLCLLRSPDEEEVKTLHAMGIESYVWKRQDFKDIEITSIASRGSITPFDKHNQILDYLSGDEPEFREVSLPAEIDKSIEEAYRILYSLSKKVTPLPEAGILIRWGISLLNSCLQLPFTIEDFHSHLSRNNINAKRMDERYDDFKTRMRESYGLLIPAMHSDECEELIKKMTMVYDFFLINNPKKVELEVLLEQNTDDTTYVYCCQSAYTSVFNEIRGNNRIQAKNIEQISSLPVSRAFVTGWSSRRNTAHGFLAPVKDLTFVLYRKELESLKYVYKTHPGSPESAYDRTARQSLGNDSQIEASTQPSYQEGQSIESILDYVTHKFNTPLYPTYDPTTGEGSHENVEAHQIQFEDGTMVYADAEHRFDKVDRTARKITRSKTKELTEGDELVFADSERSMFEELLNILQKSEEYRNVATTANIWREALRNYVDDNNVSDRDLVSMFNMVGCPRTIHTIRSWLGGNVIGPPKDNYAAIGAIAKITRNQNLISNQDEVIRACKTLHALHVKTGWLLVRNIINSAIESDDSELNEETRLRLQAYSGSARLAVVKTKSEQTFSVPISEIGKLHEAFA